VTYSPWDRVSDDITFDRFPHIGFEIGDSPDDKVRFAFWRRDSAPDDWQVTKRVITNPVVLSGRNHRQHLPDGPLVLDTGLWFRSGADYRQFLAIAGTTGTLRMNRSRTMHQPDRTVTLLGRTYAEFDNVTVMEINAQSFDNDGGVRCHVLFHRDSEMTTQYVGYALTGEDEA
jgi:hypothetical protein